MRISDMDDNSAHSREREKNSEKGKKLNRSAAGSISVDLLNAYNT